MFPSENQFLSCAEDVWWLSLHLSVRQLPAVEQLVVSDESLNPFCISRDANFGSCVEIEGIMVASPGPSQPTEMQAERITVWGPCDGLVRT